MGGNRLTDYNQVRYLTRVIYIAVVARQISDQF